MRRPRLAELPGAGRAASWTLAVAILCVVVARVECLLDRPPCLAAHGELTWFGWAYRHPRPDELFRRVASRLREAEPIVIVAAGAADETYWWRGMASYFLGGHRVDAVMNLGARRPMAEPGRALVVIRSDGRIRVVRGADR